MNENKTKAWLYVIITAIVSAVAVVFQIILNNHYTEADSGFYTYGAQTPTAYYIFVGVALFLMITSSFVLRRDSLPKELNYSSVLTGFAATVAACGLIFLAVVYFMSSKSSVSLLEDATVARLENVCMLLAFPTAVYFFIVAFSGSAKSKFSAIFSFFPVIWTLIYLMSVYFDHSEQMNNPHRTLTELALILLMLYQLYETRAMLGRSKAVIYFILANSSVLFLSVAFIPEIAASLKGGFKLSIDLLYAVVFVAMAVYIFTRSISFAIHSDGETIVKKKKLVSKASAKDDLFASEEE